MLNATDGESEHFVDFTHPLRVAPSEVVVYCHQMNAAPGERIQVDWTGGDQRFAFTGGHLGNLAFVQDDSPDELNIEMNHVPDDLLVTNQNRSPPESACRIFHQGECLGQNRAQTTCELVWIVKVREILFPLSRLLPELIFRERLKFQLELIDLLDERSNSFDLPLVP